MKPYDATKKQKCEICHFEISHNKQGWFTLHLKAHGLTLNEYLIKYYYHEDDLRCSYELCEKLVSLRRGKPKQHCSTSCAAKGKPLQCHVCGTKFEAQHRGTKTCSPDCAKKLKAMKIVEWHQSMSEQTKNEHFTKIIKKTAKTRKDNKTPSWNSGKTGIYSEETIEKIRAATLKQMKDHVFQKTNIERVMEEYLLEIKVNYKYSFILEKRQFDFLLAEHKLIIECDGDYWHANPKFYPDPQEWQVERIKIDHTKNEIAQNNGYRIARFWEDDILNNFEYVKCIINDLLATT
ncbi:endonuclease domain-containing protein [Metabacillus bambusae]|uniref:DUF559 domain-containing protein n=1 Tax=Metabacillus bambusae TaxID=2795218 RepID=A0ABS3N2F1_9BACI|nr:DUF559 domain-containing protein [Metabacillus bambusae]MBO1512399.1 DUF559 domain-containing protein [Metabacillus bambusae]